MNTYRQNMLVVLGVFLSVNIGIFLAHSILGSDNESALFAMTEDTEATDHFAQLATTATGGLDSQGDTPGTRVTEEGVSALDTAVNLLATPDGRIVEVSSGERSIDPRWILNSGAYFFIHDQKGETIQGDLPAADPWRQIYAEDNPADTDNGLHPQNIFRLRTSDFWADYTQETFFEINAYHVSTSTNRNQSNGVLHFNRYLDQDNLYYSGLRVDGYAVIKKKTGGDYHTLAIVPVFDGPAYDRDERPSLLPAHTPLGIRTEVKNLDRSRVLIILSVVEGRTGKWREVARVIDDGVRYGGPALSSPGHIGIRTDFMDVTLRSYRVTAR